MSRINEIWERADAKFPSWSDCLYLLERVEKLEEVLGEIAQKAGSEAEQPNRAMHIAYGKLSTIATLAYEALHEEKV